MAEHVITETLTKYHVCPEDGIPDRGRVLIRAGNYEIGVFRVHGSFYAYENRCRHQGGPVCRGDILGRWEERLNEGGEVIGADFSEDRIDIACPWHGWEYDLTTGRNIADERISLRSFPVEVEDGEIYVGVPGPSESGVRQQRDPLEIQNNE
jgi:nitrite reductase (NADH) small subunit